MKPRRISPLERQLRDRGVYNAADFEWWLSSRGWSWQKLDRGDYGMSVEHAVLLCTVEDPVLWARAFLIEPDTQKPYSLWDYQTPSLRSFGQDVVHQDAAEVGKTREIIVLSLWTAITGMGGRIQNPSILIGAPQQVFLDDIFRAMEAQAGVADGVEWKSPLKEFWLEPIRTPHKCARIKCINPANPARPTVTEIHFRPAGHDGTSFRGAHVNALAIMEEAAKIKNKTCWSEFMRSMKPTAKLRVYSVPDGDRTTDYYRMCTEAVPDLPAGQKGTRKFHWPKSLMPSPFWDAEREEKFVKLFGGRDTPGYKRNVLGEWGDTESPVLSWSVVLPNVTDLSQYRKVILSADGATGTLYAEAYRVELVLSKGQKAGRDHALADSALELSEFAGNNDTARRAAWAELMAPHLGHLDPRGVHWVGADLGERGDPTEIIVSEQVGNVLRDVLRVKAKGLSYFAQCDLIFVVDKALGHSAFWGVDMGNAGTMVVKNLLNLDLYAEANFDERLVGYHFQQSVPCISEDGEALEFEDAHGDLQQQHAPAKHWATLSVVARAQRQGYQWAYDAELLGDYTSQTARQGAKWPLYSKQNDHGFDGRRLQILRKLATNDSAGFDVFSGKTYDRRAA